MAKVFYDHLILIDEIYTEIDRLNMHNDHKQQAKKHIDTIIHYQVLDLILSHLPKNKHEEFLNKFHHSPYDHQHLQFVEEYAQMDMQKEIANLGEKLKNDILIEIKKYSTR